MNAAIILAGSHVWKEDSLESLSPRPLLPVANAPLITYALAALREADLTRVVICSNESSHLLQAELGDGERFGLELSYYEDRMPRGPAGCARDSSEIVAAEHYLVLDGTIVPSFNLRDLMARHESSGAAATVVYNARDAAFGDSGGKLSPTGIHVFSRGAIARVGETGYQDIKEVLVPRLRSDGDLVLAEPCDEPPLRISGLDSYLAMQGWMLDRLGGGPGPGGYERRSSAWCHPTTQIADSARLVGPVMLGPQAVVEEDAVIIGPTVLGAECVVERGALVGRSVLWNYGSVGVEARVEHCLVATAVSVEPGAVRHGEICRMSAETPRLE